MSPVADVELRWFSVVDEDDEMWEWTRCLYCYLTAAGEVLYIGKADGRSVRERWKANDKLDGFWHALERDRGILEHALIVGAVMLPEGARLTRHLLGDVESLLIFHHQPWGNIQAMRSRIERPGLRVRCVGACWPGARMVVDGRAPAERYTTPSMRRR